MGHRGIFSENSSGNSYSYGLLHLGPFAKAIEVITGSDQVDLILAQSYFYREAVWTSFFGPLWVDFGWFSFFIIFLFGIAAKVVAGQAQMGRLSFFPLHIYLTLVIFFMPVLNFIVSAQGMYLITAFSAFAFIYRPGEVAQKEISI